MVNFIDKYVTNIRALQTFQVLRYAVLFAAGMLFAHAGLATELIGLYEKLLFFASVLSFFWVSGFIQALLSSHGKAEPGKRSEKLFSVFAVVMVCSVLSFIIFRISATRFLESDDETVKNIANIFSFYLMLANPAFLVEYIYLLLNKPKSILVYGIVSFSVQLWLVVGPVYFTDDAYAQTDVFYLSICGVVASAGFRFLWLMVLLFRNAELKINTAHIKALLLLGSPLIVSAILSGSIEYINGFIVQHFFDDALFAVFRNGAKELPLALLLANSFSNAMLPKFSEVQNISEPLEDIKKSSLRLMHFLFPVTIVLMLLSKTLYPILFNPSFTASAGVFNIYLLLIISRMIFPQTILIGLKQTKPVLLIAFAEAFINIVFSISLIQVAGIEGVAWGVVIACTAEKIFLAAYVKAKLKIPLQQYASMRWLLIYSCITVAAYIFAYMSN